MKSFRFCSVSQNVSVETLVHILKKHVTVMNLKTLIHINDNIFINKEHFGSIITKILKSINCMSKNLIIFLTVSQIILNSSQVKSF